MFLAIIVNQAARVYYRKLLIAILQSLCKNSKIASSANVATLRFDQSLENQLCTETLGPRRFPVTPRYFILY